MSWVRQKGERVYEAWNENAWTAAEYVDATDKYVPVVEHEDAVAERDAEIERLRVELRGREKLAAAKAFGHDCLAARVEELTQERDEARRRGDAVAVHMEEIRDERDREREQRERLVEMADGLLETLSQIDVVGPIGDIDEFEEARDDLADALAAARTDDEATT